MLQDVRLGAEAIAGQGAQSPAVAAVAVAVAVVDALEESLDNPTFDGIADENRTSSRIFRVG